MHRDNEQWEAADSSRQYSDSKKASSGRKGRLDHNVLAYYRETLHHLDELRSPDSGSTEDYDQLLNTVFDSLAKEGRQLSQNQTGSRLAESLVNLADWPRLSKLLSNFAGNWPAVIVDRFAHRVLQTAIRRYLSMRLEGKGELAEAKQNPDDCYGEASQEEVEPRQLWSSFAEHMRLHYPEYLEHPYACHVLRSYLLLIGGVLVGKTHGGAGQSANPGSGGASFAKHDSYDPSCSVLVEPPLELDGISVTDELDGLCSRFLENKHILSLIDSEVTGPFLQVLMLVLKLRLPKRFRKFYRHLVKKSGLFDATCEIEAVEQKVTVPSLFCSSAGCYFLEQLLALLSAKQLRKFVATHVSGKEAALALHSNANFILQRLIVVAEQTAADDGWFASMINGAVDNWLSEAIRQLSGRQQQLLVLMLRRCRTSPSLQAAVTNRLASLAGQSNLFQFVAGIGSGGAGAAAAAAFAAVGVAGGQMLEEMFQFADTERLRSALLTLDDDVDDGGGGSQLERLCRCPRGNRVVEAFLSSRSVPIGAKLDLCDRLLTSLPRLCCDKHGSRVSDALWAVGDHQLRERVARQLGAGGRAGLERLRSDKFGRFACQKFAPELLASRPGDWRKLQQRLDEAKQINSAQKQQKQHRSHQAEAKAANEGQPASKKRRKFWKQPKN